MRVSGPEAVGVKVWPAQDVEVNPKPLLVTLVFCWLIVADDSSVTVPGLPVRLQFAATPV